MIQSAPFEYSVFNAKSDNKVEIRRLVNDETIQDPWIIDLHLKRKNLSS
jgi:hypothetical protein